MASGGQYPPFGTLLHMKGSTKALEFRGRDDEGRIVLKDPASNVSFLVKAEEVCWKPLQVKPGRVRLRRGPAGASEV